MLSLLHIENIAIIESADISFDHGFNVLTGETGAGKSIVIDAISAILGERAYRDMIRTGASKASVQAVFSGVPNLPWFEENGVEYDSETMIQREIHLDGKNVCRVNGTLVSVSILRKLGIQLINIRERSLAENCHKLLGFFASCIGGKQLVHGVGVVLARFFLADTLILKTRTRGQNINRRCYTLTVKLTTKDYLTLGNISCKVRNWMSNVIIRHC